MPPTIRWTLQRPPKGKWNDTATPQSIALSFQPIFSLRRCLNGRHAKRTKHRSISSFCQQSLRQSFNALSSSRFTSLVKVVRLDEIRVLFIFAIKVITMTRDMRIQHTTTQGEYCRVRKVTMLKTSEEVKRARIRKIYLHKVLDCHTTK